MTQETVSSLAAHVGGRVVGDGAVAIDGIADLRDAGRSQIGFVRDLRYADAARASKAGAVITGEELPGLSTQIVVDDVALAFARIALRLHPLPRARTRAIHPSAVVDPAAELDDAVEIGATAVVGRSRIAAGSVIMAGSQVGDGCTIGRDCILYPRVVCYDGVHLGDRVVLHAGTVVGSDGFGYARDGHRYVKVPQVGGVRIDDDVEIGANCTVDRGAIGNTRIGARTKIDNLCHVAHNCSIGEDCAFAGATYVAGSTTIGDRVTLAGHVAVGGHIKIVSDVRIAGNSCVLRSVRAPGDYMGHPLVEKMRFMRMMGAYRRLVDLTEEVDELRRRAAHKNGSDD